MSAALIRRATIAAIATPAGSGGVGIVRVSGEGVPQLIAAVLGRSITPRQTHLCRFLAADGRVIDQGVAIHFPGPNSYTGEDVLELQGHGGVGVMQALLARCLEAGCSLAEPGEFTQRAWLNHKMDLAQAEAVADLIAAASADAARYAMRSLSGEFSQRVTALVQLLIALRVQVEGDIDFPEEALPPALAAKQARELADIDTALADLLQAAERGAVLRDGLTVVLIGRPNVGKSSLLNCLAGEELAIVTPVAGTTRDAIRASVNLEGVPVHFIDTAGLRATDDPVEKIGIERTWQAIQRADVALLLQEAGEGDAHTAAADQTLLQQLPAHLKVAKVYNKVDLHPGFVAPEADNGFVLSARSGEGLAALRAWLLDCAGWQSGGEGVFLARARHLALLRSAAEHLHGAAAELGAVELLAERLRLAQHALSGITGEFVADDLLGEIFSTFCIGK